MDIFFAAAERSKLRITAGQVLSDRMLRPELLTTPDIALAEGRKLIERWHGDGRLRYAVTPRFSLSASEAMLEVCAELMDTAEGIWFTSHMNENTVEVARVIELFAGAEHYLGSYYQHGLVTAPQRVRPQCARRTISNWSCWPRPGPGWRTARPATRRWAAGCSRSAGTSSTAPGWPWARTWAAGRASR